LDRLASIKLQLDLVDRCHDEELAAKAFELLQTLRNQWLAADYAAKRRILEIVFLNCVLEDATLVPSSPHYEKAPRRTRRRAWCLVKSG